MPHVLLVLLGGVAIAAVVYFAISLILQLDCWLFMRKLLAKGPKNITDKDLTRLENARDGTITCSADRFAVQAPKFTAHVEWAKLTRIFCYKRDLLTTDLICLGFFCADNQPGVEVHEEMQGFLYLRRELERRFPVYKNRFSDWILSSRAFDNTVVPLWEKEAQTVSIEANTGNNKHAS